jgi:LPS sulfotransferase NodH
MPTRGYLVCCIERTGSNLLTGALARTGLAGQPLEYFNHSDRDKPWMIEILGDQDIVSGFSRVLKAGTTPNGVFGAKIHLGHFRRLGMTIAGDGLQDQRGDSRYRLLRALAPDLPSPAMAQELLWARFPDLGWQAAAHDFLRSHLPDLRFIWLTRRNMVMRAISLIRARRTGRWWKASSSCDVAADAQDVAFDPTEIHIRYCLGLFEETLWLRFFENSGVAPHRVVYEEFVPRYEPTVRDVLGFLDLDLEDASVPAPRSAVQSDSLSLDWERQYREWSAAAGFDTP